MGEIFDVERPSPKVNVEQSDSYLTEGWVLYAISVTIIFCRWAVRLRTIGLRGLQGDDYLTFLFLGVYTVNAAVPQVTYYTGGNLDVNPDEVGHFSQHDVDILVYGSKLEFMTWYTYISSVWTLKYMVLFFYRRLVSYVFRRKTIILLFWFCSLSFLALVFTISFSCHPIHLNWQIDPLPGQECTFRPQNFWVMLALNLSTDISILAIPVPILWHLRISKRRKAAVSVLLLSGIFIMATTVVRAIMIAIGGPSAININRWGSREIFVGVLAVNAPILTPAYRKAFWKRGRYIPSPDNSANRPEMGIREVKDEEDGLATGLDSGVGIFTGSSNGRDWNSSSMMSGQQGDDNSIGEARRSSKYAGVHSEPGNDDRQGSSRDPT